MQVERLESKLILTEKNLVMARIWLQSHQSSQLTECKQLLTPDGCIVLTKLQANMSV